MSKFKPLRVWELWTDGKFNRRWFDEKKAVDTFNYYKTWEHMQGREVVLYVGSIQWREER